MFNVFYYVFYDVKCVMFYMYILYV